MKSLSVVLRLFKMRFLRDLQWLERKKKGLQVYQNIRGLLFKYAFCHCGTDPFKSTVSPELPFRSW